MPVETPVIDAQISQPLKQPDNGNFYVLRQDSVMAVTDTVDFNQPFPHEALNGTDLSKIRAERQRLKELLGIARIDEIPELKNNPSLRAERTERAYELIAGTYNFEGTHDEIQAWVEDIGKLADSTIDEAAKDLPFLLAHQGSDSFIRQMHNPVDLAIAMHDTSLEPIDRFRAIRKLVLMGLGGSIDFREREVNTEETYNKFRSFMEEYVLNPESETDKEERYILSTHDPETFETLSSTIISKAEKEDMILLPGQKLTRIHRRSFTLETPKGPREIGLHLSIPTGREDDITTQKMREKMILKLLRKGHENPALAVDDEVGTMVTFNSKTELKLFLKHLSQCAAKAGSLLQLEEVEDTIDGGEHHTASVGSSSDLQWYKAFARMAGIRPEIIGHTLKTLTDYLYKKGRSHKEYSKGRFIDSGVMELLFPHDLYGYDPATVKDYVVEKVRQEVEDPNVIF